MSHKLNIFPFDVTLSNHASRKGLGVSFNPKPQTQTLFRRRSPGNLGCNNLSLRNRIEALDELFGYLLWFAGVIVEILLAASFVTSNLLLFAIPIVAFLLWAVLIVWAFRARFKFRNRYEMRFLETARAYAYFVCLAFTMTANSIEVFYQSAIVTPVIVMAVGIGLNLIIGALVSSLFSDQVALFEKEQKAQFKKILSFVGSATIYYSLAVAVFDFLVFGFLRTNFRPGILEIVIMSTIYLIPAYLTYDRENRSRKLQESLAISLRETRLKNKYEVKQKQKKKRKEERLLSRQRSR